MDDVLTFVSAPVMAKQSPTAPPLTHRQLRYRLRLLNLSQRRFAVVLQMDLSTVNRWATGKQSPPHWVRLLLDSWIKEQGLQMLRNSLMHRGGEAD